MRRRAGDVDWTAKLLENWYRTKARLWFGGRLEKLFPALPDGGTKSPGFVRRLTRCWGSMSSESLMLLNTRLVQAPLLCIDCVIVHELCHLEHPNHGRAFYLLLERMLPDWKARKQR